MQRATQNSGQRVLNDKDARHLLQDFGITFVPEAYVDRLADVVAAAQKIGFPVVLKGIGTGLLHKTDRGLVHLHLMDAGAVETAAQKSALKRSRNWTVF